MSDPCPVVRLKAGAHKRLAQGHPWAFSNEIVMDGAARALDPGTPVGLEASDGRALGVAQFNPRSLVAARLISRSPGARLDRAELARRIARAAGLRNRLFDRPHYRLVHAEADGLPGLAIDRFGEVAVCRIDTAGMERLADDLAAATMEAAGAVSVVLRGDSPVRRLEGLGESVRVVGDRPGETIEVEENGLVCLADPVKGRKTGWFFDQRDNRAFLARLADGATVLDVYAHTGGFGLACAAAGAARVTMVDRSEPALGLARAAAAANGLASVCGFAAADAFEDLARRRDKGEAYDVVVCDPPAFARARKDLGAGARGYRKLARLAARLVAPGGVLAVASRSHVLDRDAFRLQLRRGLRDAGRDGAIVRDAGAGPDHPIHPHLPESACLKFVCLSLDRAG